MNNVDYIKKLVSSRSKKGGPKLPPSLIDYNNGMNILSVINISLSTDARTNSAYSIISVTK